MSTEQRELNVLIEKICCNDTSLGSVLDCYDSLWERGCRVTDDSFAQFIEALKVNTTLTEIDFGENELGDEGAKYIGDVLKVNTTLKSILLYHNEIGDAGVSYIAEALKLNNTLNCIDFWSDECCLVLAIAEALKVNTVLTALLLPGNAIGDAGVKHFADVLKVNTTLTSLNVGGNQIGEDGVRDIAKALKVNSTLANIQLTGTVISKVAASCIVDAFKVNATLTSMRLSWQNSKYVDKDALDTIEYLCKRNVQLQKPVIHARIVDIVMALSSFDLPPYVILEIIDRFEYWSL
eukprot:CAMPEP_0168604022 /NCGR_PEP_ID=MMETSP0420-20121227/15064_1 /TAXON_ID=498008 /ORGANISM="Pessonella sp." /LENGTH=292 /DNA_ID=CAMNT_0008643089 /DNA_START=46 /DNA_END=922 /DNA_ORIENTATION=-